MSYSPAWQAARAARAARRAVDPKVQARAAEHAPPVEPVPGADRRDTMAATLDMAAPKGSAA